MTQSSFMEILSETLDEAKAGILSTVDPEGRPWMRWMTPTVLKGDYGTLYAVTSKTFRKVAHVQANPHVSWFIQNRTLTRIVSVSGKAQVIDNPAMKMAVIEAIGPKLQIFWKLNTNPDNLVVLETIMESGNIFHPLKGLNESISFGTEVEA